MSEAELLAWHIEWRRKVRSAMRLWMNAAGYRDGCDRLTQLKAVFNELPPSPTPSQTERE